MITWIIICETRYYEVGLKMSVETGTNRSLEQWKHSKREPDKVLSLIVNLSSVLMSTHIINGGI